MTDLEAKRAELLAKQRAELEKMEAEHAIAVLAPIPPRRVMLVSLPEKAWLTYEAESLWAALDIMAKFQPLALGAFRGTYFKVEPAEMNAARKERERGEEQSGPYVCEIDVSQGEGFGPNAALQFYARLGDDVCKVKVDLKPAGYGPACWHNYGAQFVRNDRGQGERMGDGRRYLSGDWHANNKLSAMSDGSTKWGTGDRRSAHFTYRFSADYDDDSTGVAGWDLDACYRLENLAREMHGERPE